MAKLRPVSYGRSAYRSSDTPKEASSNAFDPTSARACSDPLNPAFDPLAFDQVKTALEVPAPESPAKAPRSPGVIPAKSQQVTTAERVQATYKQLSLAAAGLNAASDELGQAVSALESALKKLNLGVSAWVKLSGSTNNFSDNWWTRDVGYAKIRDKWGVALRTASGNYAHPDDESSEEWPFSEAPRWMRAEAVNKLPDLLEALLSKALETTKGLTSKTAQVYELTAAIDAVAKEPEPERPW